jgi:2-C-methyl-D-erythritol 4-phosphate cytidylyltransferase
MVERIGGTVRLFMGSYRNLKITTQDDLPVAEAVLRSRA